MIKTVIFDIGNVLVDFCWEPFFRSFGFPEDIFDRLAKATVQSPDWKEFDRGVLTDEEIIRRFIAVDPEIEPQIRQVMADLSGIVAKREDTVAWIRALKGKGYQVLVLSNFSHKAETDCKETLSFLEETDGGILSYQEKLIKPMPAIYWTLLSRYGLKAEECVFLDDMERNIRAAEAFGIHGILFRSREQAVEELKALGVDAEG